MPNQPPMPSSQSRGVLLVRTLMLAGLVGLAVHLAWGEVTSRLLAAATPVEGHIVGFEASGRPDRARDLVIVEFVGSDGQSRQVKAPRGARYAATPLSRGATIPVRVADWPVTQAALDPITPSLGRLLLAIALGLVGLAGLANHWLSSGGMEAAPDEANARPERSPLPTGSLSWYLIWPAVGGLTFLLATGPRTPSFVLGNNPIVELAFMLVLWLMWKRARAALRKEAAATVRRALARLLGAGARQESRSPAAPRRQP